MASLSATLTTGLITFNLHRRIIWSAAQSTQFLQKWRHVQGVRELRGSFKLLVHVLMWEITWEETAVNHQSTEWQVALACFFLHNWIFPCQTAEWCCVRAVLTCISVFVCVCFLEFARLLDSAGDAYVCVWTNVLIYARAAKMSTSLEVKQLDTTHSGLQHLRLWKDTWNMWRKEAETERRSVFVW